MTLTSSLTVTIDRILDSHATRSVVPPSSVLSHSSILFAPEAMAAMAESRLKHLIARRAIDLAVWFWTESAGGGREYPPRRLLAALALSER